jgi:hypothetical protein
MASLFGELQAIGDPASKKKKKKKQVVPKH